MLYEILLAIVCFLTPFTVILAFIVGYNTNTTSGKKIGLKRKAKKSADELFLENINNYNGTSEGQKVVK